jgi:hypothetical protein
MKVALLGNMNNNFFSLMRYFRDLGCDAHLLLYTNDGAGSLAHFRPEDDTWHIDRWRPYIHQTRLPNGPVSGASLTWAALNALASFIRQPRVSHGNAYRLPLPHAIRRELSGYDLVIGTGVAPALLLRAGLRLDAYAPYAVGIEYISSLEDQEKPKSAGWLHRRLFETTAHNQTEGLRRTRLRLNADLGLTASVFKNLGLSFIPITMPMVYDGESYDPPQAGETLQRALARINQANFRIICHARHHWQPSGLSAESWVLENKHNDWLCEAFAKLVQDRPGGDPLLVMFEYGKDVAATKALCERLGISERVLWLPKLPRREIFSLLKACDLGVGEFVMQPGTLWGGTGWEVLASGRPLLHGFPFAEGAFENALGHPPPRLFKVREQPDVHACLLAAFDNPDRCKQMGSEANLWFKRYNGVGLAKTWLDLLTDRVPPR